MINHITVMGRIVNDPEVKTTNAGDSVMTIRIACDRDYKNKTTGEHETDFLSVIAWRNTAEFIARNFSKGSMILVDGRLQMRNYTDKDGNNRKSYEILTEHVYFCNYSEKANNQNTNPDVESDDFD